MASEPNKHTCVCGYETPHWANMLGHRRQCDSWKEHQRGQMDDARALARAYDERTAEPDRPECPYCGADFGNVPLMLSHLPSCSRATLRELGPYEAGRVIRRIESMLAFKAWCEENGRP